MPPGDRAKRLRPISSRAVMSYRCIALHALGTQANHNPIHEPGTEFRHNRSGATAPNWVGFANFTLPGWPRRTGVLCIPDSSSDSRATTCESGCCTERKHGPGWLAVCTSDHSIPRSHGCDL